MVMSDGAVCPHCTETRTWWLPRMGEFPPLYWCVRCGRTFRPAVLAGVTDRQGDYVRPAGEQPRPGAQGRLL